MIIERDVLAQVLPKHMQKRLNAATVGELNRILTSVDERERFKDTFIGYTSVLMEGKYSIQQYIDAVKYVSYKHMGDTNLNAFKKTFPNKILRYKQDGKNVEQINSFVSGYNKTKLVTSMMKQSAIPLYVLNQDAAQEAINAQLKIIRTSSNDLAIVKAADSLLSHLAPPVETKIAVAMGIQETPLFDQFREETRRLAEQQRALIEQGVYTAKEIAAMPIVGEATYVDVS